MASLALLGGLLAGVFGTALVFADATRRDLPLRSRYRWTAGVAVASVGGSSLAYLFDGALFGLYLDATRGDAVAVLPREYAGVLLLAGLAASAAAVLAYGFGSRFGPLRAA